MILLHRLTSFIIGLVVATGFSLLILRPDHSGAAALLMLTLVPLLFGRLLKWQYKTPSFWVFLGTPFFFVMSSLFFFLFLESNPAKMILGVIVTFGAWLFAENLFSFYHLPSTYQAYALEYSSLVLFVSSGFFFTSGAYAAQMFLQLPVWVPALSVFWVVLFSSMGVFWVSKVSTEVSAMFAFSGALIMTELYIVLAMLPTGFVTNAAAFSIFLYLFLGLTRVHVLEKFSKKVLFRYLKVSVLLLFVVFATSRWV